MIIGYFHILQSKDEVIVLTFQRNQFLHTSDCLITIRRIVEAILTKPLKSTDEFDSAHYLFKTIPGRTSLTNYVFTIAANRPKCSQCSCLLCTYKDACVNNPPVPSDCAKPYHEYCTIQDVDRYMNADRESMPAVCTEV